MRISELITASAKPALYEKETAFMWTDKHISKQLLSVHLNPDVDLASRKFATIKKTSEWILNTAGGNNPLKILDLGCGPGLYTELFASQGHTLTGVDISANSIEYARKSAFEKRLPIDYINSSYLDVELPANTFDLIVLIYTDLGVLLPKERNLLIGKIVKALKPGGRFIFDVLRDNDLETKITPKNWEASDGGFWSALPYLALSESFLYEEQKVILYQHLVSEESGSLKTYRFWTHFFSEDDIRNMLAPHNFTSIQFYNDVLPKGDLWSGENVIFTIISK